MADEHCVYVRTRHGSAALAREDLHTVWAIGPDGTARSGEADPEVSGPMATEAGSSWSLDEEPESDVIDCFDDHNRNFNPPGSSLEPKLRLFAGAKSVTITYDLNEIEYVAQ